MPKRLFIFFMVLSFAGYIFCGYFIQRTNFPLLIGGYSALFLIYFLLIRYRESLDIKRIILSGLLFRIVLLAAVPSLSDDFYRFIWDGVVQNAHLNPYASLPAGIMAETPGGFAADVFLKLNSPNYYSVYPPVMQFIFRICNLMSNGSVFWNIVFLKLFIIAFEAGTMLIMVKLLAHYKLSKNLSAIYILNPLVILELTGNIHFEAGMIFFTLLTVWMMIRNKLLFSSATLAAAICIKLLPLLFIPLFCNQLPRKKIISFVFFTAAFCIAFTVPYLYKPKLISNFLNSLQLYYGKFEFNGSIYLLARQVGYTLVGYNPIYFLSKITLAVSLLAFVWIWIEQKNLVMRMFLLLAAQLCFAATVHPWYVAPLVALTPFIKFRFALIWSALIPLTYFAYSKLPYQENYWLVGLEYGIVFGFLVWEVCVRLSKTGCKKT